ncbi:hypothetical protein [Microbacterium sp.]|uniref:hypothetical protein n=1 Tax=Microbacterium sp. TaxID=51671 RepID=UPI003A90E0F5
MSSTKKSVGALTVVLAVVGGVTLLGAGGTAAFAGARQVASSGGGLQADVQGVSSLDLEVGIADMTVEFSSEVEKAELSIEQGSTSGWSVNRDGDELKVRSPRNDFWGFHPFWTGDDQRATLLLPDSLRGIDADLSLDAGSLSVDGDFAELGLDVNAGALTVAGTAKTVDAEVNAGRAQLDLSGVQTVDYSVSAGRLTSTLTTVPDQVDIETSAGAAEVTLPRAEYDVRQDVSFGSLDSRLTERPGSGHVVKVSASAGSVTLREG